MATNYTQWVIPVQSSYGLFKITINRDDYDFNIVNTDRCVLSPACTFVKQIAPYSMKYNEEELLVTVDLNSLGFLDRYDYFGTVDGVATGIVDLKGEGLTLLNLIFNDPSVLYTVWVSFDNNGTWEHFFNGEIKTDNIEWNNNFIEGERTVNEIKTSVIKVPVSSMIERLKSSTIADLTATIDETDCGNSVRAAFYGGFLHAATPNGETSFETGLSDPQSNWNDFLYNFDAFDVFGYRGYGFGSTFPQGFWGISFDTVIAKIAELVGYDYTSPNPATDSTLRLFDALWNDGTTLYEYDFAGGVIGLGSMYMNYNTIFGFDPNTGLQTLTSPVTYSVDDTLDQVIKDICLQFGLIMEFTIEQSGADEGKPRLNLFKRRGVTATTMPTNWRVLSDASQKPRDIRAKSVRAKYVGDEDVLMTPLRSDKEPFDVELRWRIHPSYGDADGVVRNHNLVYNSNFETFNNNQKPSWWATIDGEFPIHADGWVGGSHIFLRQTTTSNQHYPPAWDNRSEHWQSSVNWSGYYTFGLVQYIDDTTTLSHNVLSVIAQLTANEMLQDRIVIERTYGGILDDTGSILTVKPRFTFEINTTEYRAIELEIDIIAGSTKVVSISKPADMDTLSSYPVYYITDNQTSSGGSGGGGGDNNGGLDGLWVALYPNSDIRNKVIPTADTYEALILQQFSATHSADLLQFQAYNNGAVFSGVKFNGTFYSNLQNAFQVLPYGASAGNTGEIRFYELTANGTNYTAFKGADNQAGNTPYTLPNAYPSVTGYALVSTDAGILSWANITTDLTDAIIKAPASSVRNTITPTSDYVALTINQKMESGFVVKARSGADGTYPSILVTDNSNAYLSGIRENGKIFQGSGSNSYLAIENDFSIVPKNIGIANGTTINNLSVGFFSLIRLGNSSGAGDTIITGIDGAITGGKQLYIINETGYKITLPNNDSGSTSSYRFYNGSAGSDVVLENGDTAFYIYDNTFDRWVLFGGAMSGGGSGGLLYWTEAENTTSPNNVIYATSFTPSGAATNIDAVFSPKGAGSILAQVPDSTATGGNKRGARSVDLQMDRNNADEVVSGDLGFAAGSDNKVSGLSSVALGTGNIVVGGNSVALGLTNTVNSSYGTAFGVSNIVTGNASVAGGSANDVSGAYCVAFGLQNEVSASYSGALGILNVVSQAESFAFGRENEITGTESFTAGAYNLVSGSQSQAFGIENEVASFYSFAIGNEAYTNIKGSHAQSALGFDNRKGSAQRREFVLKIATPDDTPLELLSAGDQLILEDYAVWTFHILVTATQSFGVGEGASYEVKGCISRGNGVGTTAILGTPVVTVLYESDVTTDVTVTADTTNGALQIIVTGISATPLLWVATVTTSEVIGEPDP